ncbi:replication initiator protein [Apis mellifera associated microvirus 1]|nr:replication initiator protein [Apis mellifera associated microvirus 1]
MPCFSPLTAYRMQDGSVEFKETANTVCSLQLPCGQCIGCRLERSRQWAARCIHEASLHKQSCFLTLTYRDECLPAHGKLVYRQFQLFMKRLRKFAHPHKVRFFMAGEYGDQLGRPHFHACIFGYDFADKTPIKKIADGYLYSSVSLEKLWPFGFSSIGAVTFESAAYVARYCLKKVTGRAAKEHYEFVDQETGEVDRYPAEFTRMSLKPGIGAGWFAKYGSEVFPSDEVIINGHPCKPPKYYDRLFKKVDPESFEFIVYQRELDALVRAPDNTLERLAVREQVTQARVNLSQRKLS